VKIIHLPYCFYPDAVGGTEAYVNHLCRCLGAHGVVSVVAAPASTSAKYNYESLAVHRFQVVQEAKDLEELYGNGNLEAVQQFARILDDEQPDIIHMHAFTRGVSVRLIREAKRRSIRVVFTYHTPTVSCQRGTLMRWGTETCDGVLDMHRCASCTLNGLGLYKPVSVAFGSIPSTVGSLVASAGLSGGFWTALRMTELVELRHVAFRAMMREVDHVVALCQWTKDLLLRNGIPANKITISRHGLPTDEGGEWQIANGERNGPHFKTRNSKFEIASQPPVRIAFLGRLHPTKGIHVLIKAIRSLPQALVRLDIYGMAQGEEGTIYDQELRCLAAGDGRITFLTPVPANRVMPTLRNYNLLAVPSQCLETGPLVVLEAFAAGIPVIGSNLGGIAELVQPGVNGLLVEHDSIEAWSHAIKRCCERERLVDSLRQGIPLPRRMDTVASEMMAVYGRC
jgi:glycosyltransferase involved in cell wall biosynthesis